MTLCLHPDCFSLGNTAIHFLATSSNITVHTTMRKGHGSSKVPNVKLRPVPAGASTSRSKPAVYVDPEEDAVAPEVQTHLRELRRPLEGVVICCTGISEKVSLLTRDMPQLEKSKSLTRPSTRSFRQPTLLKKAAELGAIHSSDYTDRITHLVASAAGSAKHQVSPIGRLKPATGNRLGPVAFLKPFSVLWNVRHRSWNQHGSVEHMKNG